MGGIVPDADEPKVRAALLALKAKIGDKRFAAAMVKKYGKQGALDLIAELWPTTPNPGPIPTPDPTPAPGPDNQPVVDSARPYPLSAPLLFISAPDYYYADNDALSTCRALAAIPGIAGFSGEVGGRNAAADGRGAVKRYLDLMPEWGAWLAAAVSTGLWAHEEFVNSNGTNNQKVNDWTPVLLARDKYGYSNSLLNPVSERDTGMKRATINKIREFFYTSSRVPPAQRADMQDRPTSGYLEVHVFKLSDIPKLAKLKYGEKLLVVSDSGEMLATLYGANWKEKPAPNLSNIRKYVQACRDIGASCVLYSFERTCNLDVARAVAPIYAGGTITPPGPATEPIDLTAAEWRVGSGKKAAVENRLVSAKYIKGGVSWKADLTGWKDRAGSKGGRIMGEACYFVVRGNRAVGGKFDDFRPPQTSKPMENIIPPGKHLGDVQVKPGTSGGYLCLVHHASKVRTNAVPIEGVMT